jgi:hypothetical protein
METTPDCTFVPSFASNKTNVAGSTRHLSPIYPGLGDTMSGYHCLGWSVYAYLNVHLKKLRTDHIWIWHYYLHYSLSYP